MNPWKVCSLLVLTPATCLRCLPTCQFWLLATDFARQPVCFSCKVICDRQAHARSRGSGRGVGVWTRPDWRALEQRQKNDRGAGGASKFPVSRRVLRRAEAAIASCTHANAQAPDWSFWSTGHSSRGHRFWATNSWRSTSVAAAVLPMLLKIQRRRVGHDGYPWKGTPVCKAQHSTPDSTTSCSQPIGPARFIKITIDAQVLLLRRREHPWSLLPNFHDVCLKFQC